MACDVLFHFEHPWWKKERLGGKEQKISFSTDATECEYKRLRYLCQVKI